MGSSQGQLRDPAHAAASTCTTSPCPTPVPDAVPHSLLVRHDERAPRPHQAHQVAVAPQRDGQVREHVQRVEVGQRVVQPPAQRP